MIELVATDVARKEEIHEKYCLLRRQIDSYFIQFEKNSVMQTVASYEIEKSEQECLLGFSLSS